MSSNQTVTFSFQFYHHVSYVGNCSDYNDSRMFNSGPALPTFYGELPGLCLTLIALILNGISLIVFCVDEWGGLSFRRSSHESTSASEKMNRSTMLTNLDASHATQSSSIGMHKRAGRTGAKRSSVSLSLLLLCVCECTFAVGKCIFRSSLFTFPLAVSPRVASTDEIFSMKSKIEILPVVQNLFYFISDVGLICRNWCVCLITIARAEVVMWPLGSRRWQRFLRTRRWFLVSFLVILCVAIILAYVKHADYLGLLCFDPKEKRFGLWMHEFIMDQNRFVVFELFGYHMMQSCLVWVLIFIFTLIIVVRLKPWKQDVDKLFSSLKQSPAHPTLKSSSGPQTLSAQADAMYRRQRSQIRATKVVVVIVVLFLVLEFASFISIAAQFAGLVNTHSATMRTLENVANTMVAIDSIANFVVFVLTLKQFRLMCIQLFCCREPSRFTSTSTAGFGNGQTSSSNTATVNWVSNPSTTERAQIELE